MGNLAKEKMSDIEVEGKKEFTLPPGAVIVKKNSTISVREIENGFLIRKSYDISWRDADGDDTHYDYYSKEWYQKENPVKINIPKEKSLADKLD